MTRSIVLLSGPPGAGKSTVAKELAAISQGPLVYIEGDTFWSFTVREVESQGHKKHFKMVMTSMTAAAIPYALAGHEVLLDFSIPPWFIETAARITGLRNIPLDYVVVRPDVAVCAARASLREAGKITDYSSFQKLYLAFDEAEQRHMIEDDTIDPVTLAAQIREGLDKEMFRIR